MNILIEQTKQKIARIKDTATERSYYPLLCEFFEGFAKSDAIKLREAHATPEETTTQYEKKVGFPDITIRNKNELVGWIEVKTPEENLGADKFREQFTKYRESLENIIFTNLREWQLWQWEDGESKQVGKTIVFDLTTPNGASAEDFEQLLIRFFEGRVYQTRTPKQLALALAKKTRLLSKQVEEALETADEKSDLWKLKETFEKTLIQDISSHQFANMVAETMAYSLFLSALEHERRGNGNELTLTNAIDYLPTNVPILADLYDLIKKVASAIPNIYESAQLLVDQLNASEIDRIRQKLVEHKPGEDPVIQFYEPFLAEYDPKEREARGVYYTPKPVVDYIVRSVDWILRNKFGKEKGLADESVNLLDPATGTGTFLMSAIQEIYWNTKKANESLGDEMVSCEFNKIVLNHILKHFYGFELLIAPYAVAHLKLTLEIERLGFDFKLSKGDGDTGNDRFKIYLANTLDDPNKPPQKLFGFDSIPAESEKAQIVKRDAPILAIIGNPPYSNFGRMNRGDWILGLLKDYKKGLGERKINLDDDFIKFIRFAQWKLEKTGQGIFAMITSNTFIDGITHRQMRRSLMDTFDEIYIYNLHGNSRKGEVAPGGGKDENVFNIQQGVSINVFVKLPEKQDGCVVKYADLWGTREHKFATLLEENLNETRWQKVLPKEPRWFFTVRDGAGEVEYENYPSILNGFEIYNSGMQTKRDNLTIHYSENELRTAVKDVKNLSSEEVRTKYDLPSDGRDWTVEDAKKDVGNGYREISVQYRPFDARKTIFTGKSKGFIAYPRADIMRNMIEGNNLGLILMKQVVLGGEYTHFGVANSPIDERTFKSNRGGTYLLPLYTYQESSQNNLLNDKTRRANISEEFSKNLSKQISLRYVPDGRGDLEKTFGPEDIFYYTYAIFHSPTYRTRYAEQLKIDFPRLPITGDKELFKRLVALGNELVNLHLLGENLFESSKTILDDSSKWNIKIGGTAPANLEEWKVVDVRYDEKERRVYVNAGQYFEGVEKEVWEFMVGGYQVCEKWLKDRKKAERVLSTDDLKHYMKIVVSLRETIRIMGEIDKAIPVWPMK
ncbi:MAG: hypothetical protein A3H76_00915 [Candidatus Lloydbacteria bacterium RIFCSPLOWO2_02_FULL_54_12]|nr:MAG: hypothetical protein A3H76_00915 [Candidatus Lloydbacteria bacterium RIFCSPLOWO2_02_FULL_54_12]